MRSQEDMQYLHDMLHFVLFESVIDREAEKRLQMRAVHDALCWILETKDHAEQEFNYEMSGVEHRAGFYERRFSEAAKRNPRFESRNLFRTE